MADNYLERKRRDYEEKKMAWLKKQKLHLHINRHKTK